MVSKSRLTQRRLVGARLHGHPLRVKATKLLRRQFLHLAAGAAAVPAVSRIATAQTYPARPVRIIVGVAAGGSSDITARLISQRLSDRLGQQFVIENRPGAGTNIATDAVVKAAPDGYTLLLIQPASAINASLYDKLTFNFMRDIAPIAGLARSSLVMLVNPLFPAKTIPEFLAYAKVNSDKLNVGTTGPGPQVALELFKMMASVNIQSVPYRGDAPTLTDLMGRQVEAYLGGIAAAIEHIKADRLLALAVTTRTRFEALPDIPTMAEFLPGYEASTWWGVGAPRNTPIEIIEKLNNEINVALADPKFTERLASLSEQPMAMTLPEFSKFIADETEKWAKVIKFAGIKAM
jgi:tripartite-type tricarboxylate transporter receptor subunit TctC